MVGIRDLGLTGGADLTRHDSGTGVIRQRTIEIGDDVIAVENIGTIRIIIGQRNNGPAVIGGALALFSFFLAAKVAMVPGLVLLFAGVILIYWSNTRKVEQYLAIGTADGKTTTIVSTDKVFLASVRTFIRDKIDSGSLAGSVINITNSKLEGTLAIGDGATATA